MLDDENGSARSSTPWIVPPRIRYARKVQTFLSVVAALIFVYMRFTGTYDSLVLWGTLVLCVWGILWLHRYRKSAVWASIPRCMECGYDLRGLPAGHRCPECGVTYDVIECLEFQRNPEAYIEKRRRTEWLSRKKRIDADRDVQSKRND